MLALDQDGYGALLREVLPVVQRAVVGNADAWGVVQPIARALLATLAIPDGCADHGCAIAKPAGMGTNGGCRCDAAALRRALRAERAARLVGVKVDALLSGEGGEKEAGDG